MGPSARGGERLLLLPSPTEGPDSRRAGGARQAADSGAHLAEPRWAVALSCVRLHLTDLARGLPPSMADVCGMYKVCAAVERL